MEKKLQLIEAAGRLIKSFWTLFMKVSSRLKRLLPSGYPGYPEDPAKTLKYRAAVRCYRAAVRRLTRFSELSSMPISRKFSESALSL